ncbi:hypothetical protein [Janthinobacterium sp. BJB304]|uniref:hypothetical protein n=1 Tax=Janthinobacterium sp. BJB304 TaxID=1572871 RepID=UPI00117AC990|nr:hypothetical protein [Janthinobacterium sp. BJB304]
MSSKTTIENVGNMNEAFIEFAGQYDTICAECNQRCCSPCTANGDITKCAYTKFENCSVCGHASSVHFAGPHE